MKMKLWCLLLVAAAYLAICSAAPSGTEAPPMAEPESSVDDHYDYSYYYYDYCGDGDDEE